MPRVTSLATGQYFSLKAFTIAKLIPLSYQQNYSLVPLLNPYYR